VDCRDCARFDEANARCKDGKVNPHSFDSTFTTAQTIGIRAICVFNEYRERIVATRLMNRSAPTNSSD